MIKKENEKNKDTRRKCCEEKKKKKRCNFFPSVYFKNHGKKERNIK